MVDDTSTGDGLMSVDGAFLRTNVCLVPLVSTPPPLVRTPLDRVMDDSTTDEVVD